MARIGNEMLSNPWYSIFVYSRSRMANESVDAECYAAHFGFPNDFALATRIA